MTTTAPTSAVRFTGWRATPARPAIEAAGELPAAEDWTVVSLKDDRATVL